MSFDQRQVRQLRAKLKPKHIRARLEDGLTLHYLEGWHVISEANRIFGFDGWDRETVESNCVYTKHNGGRFEAVYIAKVRITVKTDGRSITREGSGTGEANTSSPGKAHELALKAAETDATKRALMTFGNAFGLSLYDPNNPYRENRAPRGNDQKGEALIAPKEAIGAAVPNAPILPAATSFDRVEMQVAQDVGWMRPPFVDNCASKQTPNRKGKGRVLHSAGAQPGNSLQNGPETSLTDNPRPHTAPKAESTPTASGTAGDQNPLMSGRAIGKAHIDKSVLAFSEPKRLRDPEHLKFVAKHGCAVCGRNRTHAHHLTFSQPRALGRKVSDEYTVPLCPKHHQELHGAGDEKAWWRSHKIDALRLAAELWAESKKNAARGANKSPSDNAAPACSENSGQ